MSIKMRLRAVKTALKQIDFFGQPVRFHRDGYDYYTSSFGGLSSVAVLLFVLLFFSSQIDSFRQRNQVTVKSENIFTDQSDTVLLKLPDFMFAIGIDQDNTGLTYRPYFKIDAQLKTSINGNKSTVPPITLDLHPCTQKSFQMLGYSDQQLQYLFESHKLNTFLCPTNTTYQELSLMGNYLAQNFTYLKISVNQCVNDSTLLDIGALDQNLFDFYQVGTNSIPPCAPQIEIDNYFIQKQQFRLSVYTTNIVVNPQKPTNITTYFLSDDLSFYFQPKSQYKTVDVFYSKYEVTTDNNIFTGQDLQTINYTLRQPYAYQEQSRMVVNNQTDRSYFDVYFRRGNIDTNVKRAFVKVDFLISQLGGFLSFMFLLFEFIVGKYNDLNLKVNMVNNFYDSRRPNFDSEQDDRKTNKNKEQSQNNDVKSSKDSQNKPLPQVIHPNQERQPLTLSKDQIKKLGFKTKKDFLYYYFESFIFSTSKVVVTLKYLVYRVVFRYCLRTKQNLMIDKAVVKIQADLDISKLINHYLEFNKLKEIILDQDQINLLDFIPKPKIFSEQEVGDQQKPQILKEVEFDKFMVVVNSFDKLMSSYHNNDIDLKSLNLIHLLGEDVRHIFLISIQLYKLNNHKNEYTRLKSKFNMKQLVHLKLQKEILKAHKISKKLTLNEDYIDSSMNIIKSHIELEVSQMMPTKFPMLTQLQIKTIVKSDKQTQLIQAYNEPVIGSEPPNQFRNYLFLNKTHSLPPLQKSGKFQISNVKSLDEFHKDHY